MNESLVDQFEDLSFHIFEETGGLTTELLRRIDSFQDRLVSETQRSYNRGYDRGRMDSEGRR